MKTAQILSVLAMTAIIGTGFSAPAHADWDNDRPYHHEWAEHEWREHHWHHRPEIVVAPQPYWVQPQPRVVYVPQPVYAAPQPYGFNVLLNLR